VQSLCQGKVNIVLIGYKAVTKMETIFLCGVRGFSVNNTLLTKERGSLAERSIVAIRVLKEAIRIFGSCTKVPITKALLQSVKQAHSEYALFLENERKQALLEEEERKKIEQAREPRKSCTESQERFT